MPHPIAHFTNDSLLELRNAALERNAENDVPLSRGIYFSWDDQGGKVSIELTADDGHLFSARAAVSGHPDWFCLNFALGKGTFAAGDIFGAVIDLSLSGEQTLTPFLRSLQDDGKGVDTPLRAPLHVGANRVLRTLLHTFEPYDDALNASEYHTFVLPLPKQDFEMTLHALRFFVVPAAQGQRSTPATIASFAV